MAVRRNIPNVGYGLTDALQNLAPQPIVSNRAPTANDIAEIGTNWVDQATNAVYCLTSVVSGAATWTTSPASGVGNFTSVTITGGVGTVLDVQLGDVSIGAGNLSMTGDIGVTGNTVLTGNLSVTGTTIFTGDVDITDTASIGLTSTNNAAGAITLTVNGGASETLVAQSLQGTGADSINLASSVGGILLTAGRNNAQAIRLNATAGGVDIFASGASAGEDIDIVATGSSVNITSTENAADSIVITSTIGGIDILAAGAAAGEDIDIIATGSSVNINSTENVADSIVISSTNGGIDILAVGASAGEDIDIIATGSSVNITSTENAAQAIYLHANGGVTETVQLHADQGTAVNSINILSDAGGITLTATGLASADAINLEAVAGGIDMDSALQTNIASSQAAVNAIRVVASDVAGGIDVDCGTGGITIDSTGAFSIDGAAASNVTTTGAGIDLTLSSVLGSVLVESTEDAALAIRLHANGGTSETIQIHSDQGTGVASVGLLSDVGGLTLRATGLASADAINLEAAAGGIDWNSALQSNIDSSQAAADAIRVIASNAAGGIDVDAGTGGITVDTTGALSLDSAAASNFTVTGAFDLSLISTLGSVVISGSEVAADAIQLTTAATGGITVNASSAAMIVHRAVNVDAPAATNALTSTSLTTGKAAVFTSSAATVDALDCVTGGIQVDPVSSAAGASPRTVSARHGQAIFTDVIANGAYGTLTVTNTLATVNSIVIGNASCTTVNSAVQIVEITPAAGSFAVRIFNAGAAATAANILVNFWLMNT